jgi:hypothetical protein
METTNLESGSPGRTSQLLMQMIGQLTEQMQILRADREADREATQAQIRMLQETLSSARPTPLPTEPEVRLETQPGAERSMSPRLRKKKPTLPDPPRFEGNRPKFRAWLSEVKNKLRVDGEAIGSGEDQFAYIYARLGGAPQQMTIAYVEARIHNGTSDPEHYLRYLEDCYGDPNAKVRAVERLRSLRQRENESFAVLLPRFERELADAGGASWPEEVKISYLEGALCQQLRLATVYANPDRSTYSSWVSSLQKLASGLDSINKEAKVNGGDLAKSRGAYPNAGTHAETNHAKDQDGDMKMAGVNKTAEKPEAPRNERRCYRCGRTGHFVASCPAQVVFPENQKGGKAKVGRANKPKMSESSESTSETSEDEGAGKE